MKKFILPYLVIVMSLLSLEAFAQTKSQAQQDTTALLGLPGDNLDLYAVLDLFQKSKTIEDFEKSLNDEKTKVNNLDLNLDKKVDFIKVITNKKDDSYTFILQVDVSKTETQDVAVILLDRDKDKKVSLQIVGDKDLYGKDYVIEPKGNSSITANPGYVGPDPVTKDVPATSTVVVQSAPIVQYVYSPAYVPYAPPYYYGYYPPWFGFATVMAVGIYRSNNWYHHGGYYGGHYHGGNNNVIINNRNSVNHYNNTRRTSNTVRNNQARGSYGTGTANRAGTRPSASTRPATSPSNRAGGGASVSNRQSPSVSSRPSPSTSNRNFSSPSTRSSSMGAGGRSMGGGRASMGGGRRR
ncbi:hypothetical protein [Solitalea koreensis]|uniref:DUF3300 domain-containing protein n=1 Tax=Solitalea koreensis TaxID=543615 RepID=A0A521AD17_9SPHI|nr:hypothetical protein [Solitalea koreensis]SMO32714.1 hypothetical protein SAMN06265350_10163 [Solitalea koreensis]